jgi:hypothetical protein
MTVQIIRPADRGAWLAARNFDVTASVAAAVFGVHPYVTPYQLWAIKTGRLSPEPEEESEAMERGNLLEPVVVEMIRRRHPDWTVTYGNDRAYFRNPELRIGATPDAFVDRPDRYGTTLCQIKTASESAFRDHWLDPETGEIVPPTWIAVQAITEATLTGCASACVAVVVITWRGTLQLHIVDVPIHLRLWKRLVDKVAEFWAMVDSGKEPDPDWSRDGAAVLDVYRESQPERRDLTGDPDIDATVERYLDAKATATAATRILDDLRPRIVRALGPAEVGETTRWEISARTTTRTGPLGQPVQSRALRIKPRQETPHAERF